MSHWHDNGYTSSIKDKCKMFHLVDVGVPHLGEEAEGWWGVWVVNGELDVSLREQTEDNQHVSQTDELSYAFKFKSSEPVGLSLRVERDPREMWVDVLEVGVLH